MAGDRQVYEVVGDLNERVAASHSASISPTLNCQMASTAPSSPTPCFS